jgi:hypothetical protein
MDVYFLYIFIHLMIKMDKIGRACSMKGTKRNARKILGGGMERVHYENQDVGGRIILKWILDTIYTDQ